MCKNRLEEYVAPLLAAENIPSLEEYLRRENGMAVLSWDGRWVCDARWLRKTHYRLPPQESMKLIRPSDGSDLVAVSTELSMIFDERHIVSLGEVAGRLSSVALQELSGSGYRSLIPLLMAHPEHFEVNVESLTVKCLHQEALEQKVIPYINEKTLTPFLEFVPDYWVPLRAVEKEIQTASEDLFKTYFLLGVAYVRSYPAQIHGCIPQERGDNCPPHCSGHLPRKTLLRRELL